VDIQKYKPQYYYATYHKVYTNRITEQRFLFSPQNSISPSSIMPLSNKDDIHDPHSPSHSHPAVSEPVRLRPASLSDCFELGRIGMSAHAGSAFTNFLYPHQAQHPKSHLLASQQRSLANLLNPRALTIVATIPRQGNWKNSSPHEKKKGEEEVVGCVVFTRLGDDEGAKRQIANRQSVWLWFLSWVLWVLVKFWNVVLGGDKSASPSAYKTFIEVAKEQDATFWDPIKFPERKNRWHVRNVVVAPAHQGKGIGKMLMREVTRRAGEEGVCIGLEASPRGEPLHRSVGFELLSRFAFVITEEERNKGGVMLWKPKSWLNEENLAKKTTVEEE
jgi:ribosomal protein S18 acetylase RimI-like enzyme